MPVQARPRTRWWVELLAIGWLLWLYDATTNLAPLRLSIALGNARGMLHVEQVLHIDPELTLDRWLSTHHTLGLILSDYYDNAHFIVTLGLLGFLWWRRADLYRPLRNTLVLVNVIGFVVFWRFPGRAAADAPRLHRRRRRLARVRLLAHGRARLGRQPARCDALAAHGLGRLVHDRDLAHHASGAGCARWPLSIRASRRWPCSRRATTSCSTSSAGCSRWRSRRCWSARRTGSPAGSTWPRSWRAVRRRRAAADRRAQALRVAVAYVTKLLRSRRHGRLAPLPQTLRGDSETIRDASTGSPHARRADLSSGL